MTHTPGDLRVKPLPPNTEGCRAIQGPKSGTHKQAQHTEIAYTVGLSNDETDQDNATRLVHCWNCHDDLLAALERLNTEIDGWLIQWNEGLIELGGFANINTLIQRSKEAREAVSKAKRN